MGKGDSAPSKAATTSLLKATKAFNEWLTKSRYETMDSAFADGRLRVGDLMEAVEAFERNADGELPEDWAWEIFRLRRMCSRLEFHFWQTAPWLQHVS